MTCRRGLLRIAAAGIALLLPPDLLAQETKTSLRRRQRRPAPVREPLPLPPPPPPEPPPMDIQRAGPGGDLAPIPNRRIEAPRRAETPPRAGLEPTIITPRQRQRGETFGPEHAPDNDDLLFREPAPGARLRIPFSY